MNDLRLVNDELITIKIVQHNYFWKKSIFMYKKLFLLTCYIYVTINHCIAESENHYIIYPDSVYQTIDNFGASDAWSMRFLGEWPDNKQSQIADWLFSTENDSKGNPKGIGLSLWRFNIGSGSLEQGEKSQINYETRTECFLNSNGTYNWNKQKAQRNFLRLAKERGVKYFLGFLNSPPVFFTKNGLATNTGRDGTFNLKDDCYDDYAHFIADVIEGLKANDNFTLNYISPVNEPDGHWNWIGPKQEGSPATNREISKITHYIGNELQKRNLNTNILINESSDYRCLLGIHMTDWQRGNSIECFFSKDSIDTYIKDIHNVAPIIAGHSYWTNTPLSALKEYRIKLNKAIKKHNIKFWQTETCIMSNDEEIGGGGGYDRTMKTALYVARIIHHDLVFANASAWQWWRAAGEDYKDGLLRMINDSQNGEREIIDSKLLWTFGNYSRFIRPGAVRLGVIVNNDKNRIIEGDTNPKGIMCSAYRNLDKSYIIVAINYSDVDKPFYFNINGKEIKNYKIYRTSDTPKENLSIINTKLDNNKAILKSKSVTTFVINTK